MTNYQARVTRWEAYLKEHNLTQNRRLLVRSKLAHKLEMPPVVFWNFKQHLLFTFSILQIPILIVLATEENLSAAATFISWTFFSCIAVFIAFAASRKSKREFLQLRLKPWDQF